MKLRCSFVDASGTSLASPIVIANDDEQLAYQTALGFRDGVSRKRGVKVFLQTEEQPEQAFRSRHEEEE